MTHNTRGDIRERRVAVAIDKDKYSLQALNWAVDNFVIRGQTLRLVHVIHKPFGHPPDSDADRQPDNQNMDLFQPLRSLCARKQIQCETDVLEDPDVAKALIRYVKEFEIEALFVGAVPKSGISRIFKGTDIPSRLLKSAPEFCNVYVISKRKVAAARPASRTRAQCLNNEAPSDIEKDDVLFDDELEALDDMNSPSEPQPVPAAVTSSLLSLSLYGSLGSSLRSPVVVDPFRKTKIGSSAPPFNTIPKHRSNPTTLMDYSSMLDSEESSSEESAVEDKDNDETRRLKIELKQTMDMYHAACKEALTAKQQVVALKEWKRKQEKNLRLGEETSSSSSVDEVLQEWKKKQERRVEEEATSSLADEATQKLIEKEVQKRVEAEIKKALSEAEERRRNVLDDLGQQPHPQFVVKYRSLFHILAVIFLYYFYFTICIIGGNIKKKEHG